MLGECILPCAAQGKQLSRSPTCDKLGGCGCSLLEAQSGRHGRQHGGWGAHHGAQAAMRQAKHGIACSKRLCGITDGGFYKRGEGTRHYKGSSMACLPNSQLAIKMQP